jgi:hypothetical protein
MPPRLLLISAVLAFGGPAFAGHATQLLKVEEGGEIHGIRAVDLTGDGRREIVAFVKEAGGTAVAIFALDAEGRYPAKPGVVFRPAANSLSGVYFEGIARLRKPGGVEIVFVDQSGVFAVGLDGKGAQTGPRKIGPSPELPFLPDPSNLHLLDLAADLDLDGVDELLLPAAEGYLILDPDEPEKPREVTMGSGHYLSVPDHRYFELTWEIPRVTVADWDGDGIPDLVAGAGGNVLLFLQRKDGTFFEAAKPLSILTPGPADEVRATITLTDVDSDSRVDLLLTQSQSRVQIFERFTAQHSLFINPRIFSPKTAGRLATPAVTWKTDGISVNPTLFDFDGDGDLDLVVTSLGLDIGSRIRKRVVATYLLFRFDARSRVFERDPWFKVSRQFPIEQLERESTEPVCFFHGDFDGDGKPDLLDIADEGHITILKGTTETGFLSASRYTFEEQLFRAKAEVDNKVVIADLNDDGCSDLIAFRQEKIYIIRSTK